jgi:DNA polymerase elongation subunit (family B)/predicted RNA-binding Zn-ribbon protein involved in translation (DUF1610 family)
VTEPKIILFDLEVLADMREVRKVFFSMSDYPGLTLKATINSVICAGWKEFGSKTTHCISAWDFPRAWRRDVNDDTHVVKAIYEVLKDADAVVTHNGKRFDWKFLQTRLIKHGLPLLPRIRHIDTCAVSKSNLMPFRNNLKTLSAIAGSHKMESGGSELWEAVAERSKKAQARMAEYCKQDVRALESVFKMLRPLVTNLPNHNLFNVAQGGKDCCPSCGSTRLQRRGIERTKTKTYGRYQCQDCGSWSRTDGADRNPRSL